METVYYHLNARRIAVGELASGGEAYRYAFIPQKKARPLPPAADNVLDFQAYRAKLASAGPDLPEAPEDREPAAPARPARRPADRFGLLSLALEVCATAAIVVFAAIASLQFLQIL